jgi:hypothetical protein
MSGPGEAILNLADLLFCQTHSPGPSFERTPVILEFLNELAAQLSMAVLAVIMLK